MIPGRHRPYNSAVYLPEDDPSLGLGLGLLGGIGIGVGLAKWHPFHPSRFYLIPGFLYGYPSWYGAPRYGYGYHKSQFRPENHLALPRLAPAKLRVSIKSSLQDELDEMRDSRISTQREDELELQNASS